MHPYVLLLCLLHEVFSLYCQHVFFLWCLLAVPITLSVSTGGAIACLLRVLCWLLSERHLHALSLFLSFQAWLHVLASMPLHQQLLHARKHLQWLPCRLFFSLRLDFAS